MECPNARMLLAYRRPGGPAELAPEDADELDRHLAGCPACAAAARRQDGFDMAVGRAMRTVAVPAGLRDRLLTDALARRGLTWRRTAYQYAAAAAVVVLAVLTASGIGFALRPAFDADRPADQFAQRIENPEQTVRAWLAAQGLPQSLPYDFNFGLLADYGKETIDGRDVPVITFRAALPGAGRPDEVRVYIVRKSQFKLDEAKFRSVQNSFCNVQVVPDDGRGVGYAILFTSPSLEPFLKPTGTA